MEFLLPLVAATLEIFVTTCKIGLSIDRPETDLVELLLSFVLLVLGSLLSVFSIIQDEIAIVEILSLNHGALIIYQSTVYYKISPKRHTYAGALLVFCVTIASVLSGVPLPKDREDLHYLAFSFWEFSYAVLFIVYFHLYQSVRSARRVSPPSLVIQIIKWNLWFSGISFCFTLLAVILLATGKVDFESSLLVKLICGLWFLYWLWLQVKAIIDSKHDQKKPFSTRASQFPIRTRTFPVAFDLEGARHDEPAEPSPVHTRHGFRRDSVIGDDGSSTTSVPSGFGLSITENRPSHLEFGKEEHELWKTTLNGWLHVAILESVSNVLDIGTGQGHWARDFATQYPTARVIGLDSNLVQVDELLPPNLEYQLSDMGLEWSFAPNRFDYIHGRMLSHWLKDPGRLCQEVFRILQPGRIFEIQDFEFTSHSEYDVRSWSDHLKEAGFINIQVLCIPPTAFTEWGKAHSEVELNVSKNIRDFKIRSVVIYGSKPW